MREYTDNASPQDPVPATLLPNRTATIFFDGLILGAYDQERSLYPVSYTHLTLPTIYSV